MLCLELRLPDVSNRWPSTLCIRVWWDARLGWCVRICMCAGTEPCILWGVIRVTYCKQIFVGISKSPGWSVCSLPFCNFLFHIHTNTYKAGRQINTPTHAFTHISYLLDRGFSRSLCAHCHRVSLSLSFATPFPDSGASHLLYRFQEAGKTSLEFPSPPFQASRWRK